MVNRNEEHETISISHKGFYLLLIYALININICFFTIFSSYDQRQSKPEFHVPKTRITIRML